MVNQGEVVGLINDFMIKNKFNSRKSIREYIYMQVLVTFYCESLDSC